MRQGQEAQNDPERARSKRVKCEGVKNFKRLPRSGLLEPQIAADHATFGGIALPLVFGPHVG